MRLSGSKDTGCRRGRAVVNGWLRSALAVALVVAVVAGVSACGGGSGPEEVTVASDIAYAPFEFTKGGEPVGFDIDLMREVGKRANLAVEFQNVRFDGIFQGLPNNLYDAGISSITITPERQQNLDFSEPYFNADQSLMVRSGSDIQSTDDLENATVGVQLGTTGAIEADRLSGQGKIAEVRTFNTVTDAFLALENEQVDAVLNDFPVSAYRVEQRGEGTLEIVQTIPTGEQYGIAFPEDSDLIGPVNDALQEIKADGTYAEIYEKWFGQKPEQIP